jgi:hypothetical protein
MVVRNLGLDEDEVRAMFKKTNGCHIKYHVLQACYVQNKEAAVAAEQAGRPMEEIVVLRDMCIKAFCCFWVVVPFLAIRAKIMLTLFIFSTLRT